MNDGLQPNPTEPPDEPVIFFDGTCGLCNRAVDLLLRLDRRARYRLAPLEGETARRSLPEALVAAPETLVLLEDGVIRLRSAAVLRIAWGLGGRWRLAGLLWLVPEFLRDAVYAVVARHRTRWFGRRPTCRVPTPAEAGRFLP